MHVFRASDQRTEPEAEYKAEIVVSKRASFTHTGSFGKVSFLTYQDLLPLGSNTRLLCNNKNKQTNKLYSGMRNQSKMVLYRPEAMKGIASMSLSWCP